MVEHFVLLAGFEGEAEVGANRARDHDVESKECRF
jgi:hypothetical protein